MITVERTDFVSVPVTDMGRARTSYEETLGIRNIAFLEDPDGNALMLHRRDAPAEA